MRQAAIFPNHDDVEDWELFFEDKSRRRAEKVRRREQAQFIKLLVAGAIFMAILTAFLVAH